MGSRPSATTLESELSPDELKALLEFARTCPCGGSFLEIGTGAGGTLCQLMNCFARVPGPRFVVVDPMCYFQDQYEIVKRNLRLHQLNPGQVDFRVCTSAQAFEKAEPVREAFDFVLIDGAHKIRYVTQDLRWLRLLRPGGIACLHDYHSKHKGVKWPVDRFLKKHPNYRREGQINSLLVLRKVASGTREINFGDELWAAIVSPLLQMESSFKKRFRKLR